MNLPVKADLMQSVKAKVTEEEYSEISNIINKNVVSLGTDEAFALRDSDGEIKAFKQKVTLSKADGTLIQPVPGGPFVISAQGYEVLSEATGTCVIFPKEVVVNGQSQMNPFVERDPDNKRVLAVYARAIAFRFSSKGVPQVADWSTMFDTPSYRMIDLLAKAKKLPQAFKLLPSDMAPTPSDDNSTWAKYHFDEATSLWINTSHEEALSWYSQIINREKKAIDFAQTFARRNAVKHLLGLQKAPAAKWDVTVLCWRPTSGNIVKWDATKYSQLQDRVGGMISAPGKEFKTPPKITNGKERVSEENGYANMESQIDPEDQEAIDITPEPEKPTETKPPSQELTEDEKTVMANCDIAQESLSEEFSEACKSLKINPNNPYGPVQAQAILAKMNENMV